MQKLKKTTIVTALLFMATITANAQFIFRISGNGLEKPSYMLGSLHVLTGDLLDSIPAFLEAENQCRQLYVETDITDSQQKQARAEQGQQLVTLPDGKTIADVLGEERMKMLRERMKETCHIDLDDPTSDGFMHSQPYFFYLSINVIMQMEALRNYPAMRKGQTMDGACIERAKARGWVVGNLDLQLNAEELAKNKETLSQSLDAQVDTLMAFLNNFDERKQELLEELEEAQTMCDYWTSGDYEGFERFIMPKSDAFPTLLEDRNKKWLPIIVEAMKEMPTLFVFGAGHLTGPKGVVYLLREAGYVVEPVK